MYNKEHEDFCEKRSRENLVETYREELLKIIEGYNCVDVIPLRIRQRLRNYGVLKRFGSKYNVTKLGVEMLNEEC